MKNKDLFADIALNRNQAYRGGLEKNPPVSHEVRYFEDSGEICDPVFGKTYRELLEEFRHELDLLRKKYLPFTVDCSPRNVIENRQAELKEFAFRFETEADRSDFSNVISGADEWEKILIPDYRGPTGQWTGFYRTVFNWDVTPGRRLFICFKGVDYISDIYINHRHVGSHEGFFSPFEFDITEYVDKLENTLVIQVRNDIPTLGNGDNTVNGDKIYAATGPGWDDPALGWHHCPPGAGVYNSVILQEKPPVFIGSVFARPDIDRSEVEIWTEVFNTGKENTGVSLSFSVYSFNFPGMPVCEALKPGECMSAGPGVSYYRFRISMADYRLWSCEEPWLYKAAVMLEVNGAIACDICESVFGMRKFHMDEETEPKGTLYLNNLPVILRGANDMGHMQRCVMNGDFGQLVDDILIAKLANMNYYRFTQRPVQKEIYRYCDMLGMMNQTDLPLFGYLRRNQFCEGARQAGEMERLIRSYPSAIMVSYINEPLPLGFKDLGHRHLFRHELEMFFEVCDRVVRIENPDRVIKHVEGDYEPPTGWGLSDFHCYCMWYTNHAMPVGKLYKGWLPKLNRGWKTGCGEYGTEGLDNYQVMEKYYPREWLPEDPDEEWRPDRISMSQTNSMHGDWYEEQKHIGEWIEKSQLHQAFATSLMTDCLRRRADMVVSTAIHLLIDAWPAGWMKTLVGVDRVPKPAYFAFRKSLKPVRVNLRCDRWTAYEGEEIAVEVWLLNDTAAALSQCRVIATLRDENAAIASYELESDCPETASRHAGSVRVKLPVTGRDGALHLDACLLDRQGNNLDSERFSVRVYKKPFAGAAEVSAASVAYLGEDARDMLQSICPGAYDYASGGRKADCVAVSDMGLFNVYQSDILEKVKSGGRLVLLMGAGNEAAWRIGDAQLSLKPIFDSQAPVGVDEDEVEGIFFSAFDTESKYTKAFKPGDFSYWYNARTDRIDALAVHFIEPEGGGVEPLLFTYKKPDFSDRVKGRKVRRPLAAQMEYRSGNIFCTTLLIDGRAGLNPVLDRFLSGLVYDMEL